jgi:predicted alpha/beta hydrolase family esterase
VRGAFLVSPPDFDSPALPASARSFRPPTDPLPFPSMVVASTSDPLVSVERAQGFAADWGSDFKLAGDAGHINAASGHGPWPEGLLMFAALMRRLKA